MADGYWNQQRHQQHPPGGPMKRPRSEFEGPPSTIPSGREMHGGGYFPRDEDLDVPDTRTIGSAYDRYLQSVQTPSMQPGEAGPVSMGRPGGKSQATDEFMMRRGGILPLEHGRNGHAMGFDLPESLGRRNREPLPLPPDASNTLYVEGLPSNCSRREVAPTALSALQGYRMDENEADSKFLRLQFSRKPGSRPGQQRGRR